MFPTWRSIDAAALRCGISVADVEHGVGDGAIESRTTTGGDLRVSLGDTLRFAVPIVRARLVEIIAESAEGSDP